ncbi:MAG TPA: hypothetical protein VKT49_26715 [Bryobacteraceae bacterium]|nr:hypothetical protein [Bryobacteraceae bacterium]
MCTASTYPFQILPWPGVDAAVLGSNVWRRRPHPTVFSNQERRPPRLLRSNTGLTLILVVAVIIMLAIVVAHHWLYP